MSGSRYQHVAPTQSYNPYASNTRNVVDPQDPQWSDWAWDCAKGCDYRVRQNPDGTRVYEFRQMGSAAEESRRKSENMSSQASVPNGRSTGNGLMGVGTGAAGVVAGVTGTLLYTASYMLRPY